MQHTVYTIYLHCTLYIIYYMIYFSKGLGGLRISFESYTDVLPRYAADVARAIRALRGSHLSNTTCLRRFFFRRGEECGKLW